MQTLMAKCTALALSIAARYIAKQPTFADAAAVSAGRPGCGPGEALDTFRVAGAASTIAADRPEVGAPDALSAEIILGTRSPIALMAYEVIPWLIAAAMSIAPMTSSIPLSLYLTSEGELLT